MTNYINDPDGDNEEDTSSVPPAREWPQNTIEKGEKGGNNDNDDDYFRS